VTSPSLVTGPGPLDHVGVAVRSIAEALPFYRDVLGLACGPVEELPHMGLRVVKIPLGDTRIELVEPVQAGTAIDRFLSTRGPGLHHVCFRVADVAAAGAALAGRGYRALSEAPQRGADGALVLFLHPKQTHGVLVELSQPAGEAHGGP